MFNWLTKIILSIAVFLGVASPAVLPTPEPMQETISAVASPTASPILIKPSSTPKSVDTAYSEQLKKVNEAKDNLFQSPAPTPIPAKTPEPEGCPWYDLRCMIVGIPVPTPQVIVVYITPTPTPIPTVTITPTPTLTLTQTPTPTPLPDPGTLTIKLASDNPQSGEFLRTNYSSDYEIEFLKIVLSASQDEDITINSMNTAYTNYFALGENILYVDGIRHSKFCCGTMYSPTWFSPITISAGGQKVLSFKATPLVEGNNVFTALKFITSGIDTMGIKSHQKAIIESDAEISGSSMKLIGLPIFNFSPLTASDDSKVVLKFGVSDADINLHQLTFKVDSTDNQGSQWNTCSAGKLEQNDFTLQSLVMAYTGTWELLNDSGSTCLGGQKVGYARFKPSPQIALSKNLNNVLSFSVNTSGASGDQVKFYLLNDTSSDIKNLEWSRQDDGIHRSGYLIRNLPIAGQPLNR